MSLACGKASSASLSSVGFYTGGKRAVKVVKKANSKGSSLIGLVPEFCSTASNAIGVGKHSVGRCRARGLERRVNIILRGTILFGKDVTSGLH